MTNGDSNQSFGPTSPYPSDGGQQPTHQPYGSHESWQNSGQYPQQPQGFYQPQGELLGKQRNTVGLIALIVAIVGFVFACIPGALIVGWILLPVAFILSIVGLALSGKTKGTSISALILSVVGTIVGVLVFLFAVGSAFEDAFDDDVSVSSTAEVEGEDDTDEAAPAGDATPQDEEGDDEGSSDDVEGTRENPGELGSVISGEEWDVTVDSFDRDMTEEVLAENQFNDEPDDGNTYAVAEVTVTYTGDDSGDPWMDLDFVYVTENGNTTAYYDTDAIGPEPDIMDIGEMYEGASNTGNVLFEIPEDDSGLLRVTPGLLSEDAFIATS